MPPTRSHPHRGPALTAAVLVVVVALAPLLPDVAGPDEKRTPTPGLTTVGHPTR